MTFTDKVNAFARTQFSWYDGRYTHSSASEGTPCAGPAGFNFQVGSNRRDVKQWEGGVGMNSTLPGAEYLGCDTGTRVQHRVSFPVGGFFTRDSENAAKISGAVNLGPISVGADSGYSTNVSMEWVSKRGKGIWLCGTNSGPTTAGVIHAQNRS